MQKTEQHTIRLSPVESTIVKQIQEAQNMTFSQAIRHLITTHDQEDYQEKRTALVLKKLENKLDGIHPKPQFPKTGSIKRNSFVLQNVPQRTFWGAVVF